jgi:hypothetical protein
MILRTLSTAVRSQNWFTAVIEFVIVVAGIFAGLQVDDWNQGRNDRIVEHQYLERLLFDMEESVAAQKVILETRDQAIDHVDQAARLLKSKSITEANIEIVAQGLDWLGFIALPMTNLVTIRELQSTGNLSLLREVKVRKALGELEVSHNTLEH